MEFYDVVRRRRMVRNFAADPVAADVLDRVLDAGRHAPSAGFSQGFDLLVLDDPAARATFWGLTFPPEGRAAYPWPGLFGAPVVIVPLADASSYLERYRATDKEHTGLGESEDRWPVPYWLTDAAMVVENILLAATAEGLGALFFGLFGLEGDESALLDAFGVPASRQPIGAIALGHPGDDRPSGSLSRGRRPVGEVVHRNRW